MSEANERILRLSRALAPTVSPERRDKECGTMRSERVARGILSDPQGHIDALVEAGVLHRYPMPSKPPVLYYSVIQPHEHEWRIAMDVDNVDAHVGTTVRLICLGCHETTDVANRVPIEVPS